ncbi:MAG: acyltransferase [Huintestinicola sp.]
MDSANMKKASSPARNYHLDIYKLVFSIIVFFGHVYSHLAISEADLPEGITRKSMGYVSVQAFFVISGMLMIKSLSKKDISPLTAGKDSLDYLIHKYKSIALPYLSALFLNVLMYTHLNGITVAIKRLPRLIPEIFAMYQYVANVAMIRGHTWYISALLIAILPLAYIFLKNRDFYIHVFAPIAAFTLFSYMAVSEYSSNDYCLDQYAYCGVIMGGIIRALSGLCFGSISWLISQKIAYSVTNRRLRVLVTICEILTVTTFFVLWFNSKKDPTYSLCAMFLLPIIFGVVFSGKSYISELFKSKLFSKCGSLSLAIYLCQWAGEVYAMKKMSDRPLIEKTLVMAGITVIMIVLHYLLIFIWKKLWANVIKPFFTKPDTDKASETDA